MKQTGVVTWPIGDETADLRFWVFSCKLITTVTATGTANPAMSRAHESNRFYFLRERAREPVKTSAKAIAPSLKVG